MIPKTFNALSFDIFYCQFAFQIPNYSYKLNIIISNKFFEIIIISKKFINLYLKIWN